MQTILVYVLGNFLGMVKIFIWVHHYMPSIFELLAWKLENQIYKNYVIHFYTEL